MFSIGRSAHFNTSGQSMPNKQPETNPYYFSSSTIFHPTGKEPEGDRQISFLQNLEKLRTEVEYKKSLLDEIESNIESIGSKIEFLTSVADMGETLCDMDAGNSAYLIEKFKIINQLKPDISLYSEQYLGLKKEIQVISAGLQQFHTEIASCFSKISKMSPEDISSFEKIQKRWEDKVIDIESLVKKLAETNLDYSRLRDQFHLFKIDEFEEKLSKDAISSGLAAYQMATGRYPYSVAKEFKNSKSLDVRAYFENMPYLDYKAYQNDLVHYIEKIQRDVNSGIPSHEIVKYYSSRLSFMKKSDVKIFLHKVIIASIHKESLARYRNKKTQTISQMIMDLHLLAAKKFGALEKGFYDFISCFDDKLYFGTINKSGQKVGSLRDRLRSLYWGIKSALGSDITAYDDFKEVYLSRFKSLHIIKGEFLDEVVLYLFLFRSSYYKEITERWLFSLDDKVRGSVDTLQLSLDDEAQAKTGGQR